jgi:serine/threonine protein kinase
LALDEDRLKARCVIKQFSPQIKGTQALEKAVSLFEQEAVRLNELGEHPYIPNLLAYFEQAQRLYLVQQFIEGENLVQELGSQGPFSEQKIRELLAGLLPVLKFVHDRNVIHRDITPSNIIRRRLDGKLVLIDFGVSKLLNQDTSAMPGTKIGTEGYAPMEQLRNGRAYPASDLYSLGVTCLYLLTRIRPEDLYDPLRGQWIWREQFREQGGLLSEGIADILDRMVRDLVSERYATASDAMRDLRMALSHPAADSPPDLPLPPIPAVLTQPPTLRPTRSDDEDAQESVADRPTAPLEGRRGVTGAQGQRSGYPRAMPPSSLPAPPIPASAQPDTLPGISQPVQRLSRPGQPGNSQQRVSQPARFSGPPPNLSLGAPQNYPCLQTLIGHSSWVMGLAVTPDGKTLVSGGLDDRILVWDAASGEKLQILRGHSRPINSLAISPNGEILVSGSDDDTIKLWQLPAGQLLRSISGHTQDVNAVAISPDGQFIASGSEDRSVCIWRLATGDRLRSFPGVTGLVRTTVISPNGQLVASGGSDNQIKVWNLNAGNLLCTLAGHLNSVQAVAITPDARSLVSGSKDRTIRIWDLKTGSLTRTIVKHLEAVNAVAITPDGRLLISGSSDKTVRIWRLATGELLATLALHMGAINAIAVSPNQDWFATASSDGKIRIWQLPALA